MTDQTHPLTGVLLMTYGSATTSENVREYFQAIYKGKAPDELISEFERRYEVIGGSPLIEITRRQAALLEEKLGEGYVVRAGMRHLRPSIDDAVRECKEAGAIRLKGIILSPQYSSFIMGVYHTYLYEAAEKYGYKKSDVVLAEPWPREKHFIEFLAESTKTTLSTLRKKYGRPIPVIFTTHSLPERVVKEDPGYLEQLQSTASAVLEKLDSNTEWYTGYQSAGHTPEAWLKPDVTDILKELGEKHVPGVLIVPIQFLSDHLEILYDLDVAGREQCLEAGVEYHRTELPNTHPLFIESLAHTVGSATF